MRRACIEPNVEDVEARAQLPPWLPRFNVLVPYLWPMHQGSKCHLDLSIGGTIGAIGALPELSELSERLR